MSPSELEKARAITKHRNAEDRMLALQQQLEMLARLDDKGLVASLARVLSQERGVHAQLLLHIAEVDARGTYRELAYASMFDYCVQALHMSEAEAYLRIRAARLGREFPRVLVMLEAGELHLSALKLLAPVLTQQNVDELLEVARFKCKRELEVLLAARFAKPDAPSVTRKLPQKSPVGRIDAIAPLLLEAGAQTPRSTQPNPPSADPRPEPCFQLQMPASASTKPRLEPIGPARYKLQLTATQQLHDKLQQARDLMRHELPDGDLAQIVERAVDLLLADRKKHRFGVGRKRRAQQQQTRKPRPDSRHIPNDVRRDVVARDGERCTFVSTEGRRCSERGWLQLHHEEPFGRGGPGTTDNIRVMCSVHNKLLAERDYGRSFIQHRIAKAKRLRQSRQLVPELKAPRESGASFKQFRSVTEQCSSTRTGSRPLST